MAYDYDTDILAGLWTGGEDQLEPYATFIADNPLLTDEDSETRILSTIEAVRSHIELLNGRDEARLLHFCLSTMLEGFGSGGFIYGSTSDNENAVVEGNVVNPVFAGADDIEFATLDGVTGVLLVSGVVAAGGTGLDDIIAAINGDAEVAAVGISAERTRDSRLRIIQVPIGGATAAAGFVVTFGENAANDNVVKLAGIDTAKNPTEDGLVGSYYLAKVTTVANNCRDRALAVFAGQIRDPDFS
jgi:hypothetical protein